eukprot:UN12281
MHEKSEIFPPQIPSHWESMKVSCVWSTGYEKGGLWGGEGVPSLTVCERHR